MKQAGLQAKELRFPADWDNPSEEEFIKKSLRLHAVPIIEDFV